MGAIESWDSKDAVCRTQVLQACKQLAHMHRTSLPAGRLNGCGWQCESQSRSRPCTSSWRGRSLRLVRKVDISYSRTAPAVLHQHHRLNRTAATGATGSSGMAGILNPPVPMA